MRKTNTICAAAIAVVMTALAGQEAAQAKEPLVLEPSTTWHLDFGQERCSLLRRFGEGKKSLLFQLDAYALDSTRYRALLVGSLVPRTSDDFSYGLSPDASRRENSRTLFRSADGERAISFYLSFEPIDGPYFNPEHPIHKMWEDPEERQSIPQDVIQDFRKDFPKFEAEVSSVALRFSWANTIELKTGSMAKPLASLRACMDDLMLSWGIDPVAYRAQTRAVKPTDETVARIVNNYPLAMEGKGYLAHVPVRVMVDEKGTPGECVVQDEGVNDVFRRNVCSGLARQFEPALDANGNPVASVYLATVHYEL